MSKKLLFFLMLTVLLIVLAVPMFYFSRGITTTSTRATQSTFSAENSYVFNSPLKARTGGSEKIRVTIFLLDNKGLGVGSKKIALVKTENLNIEAVQATTDTVGRAVFDVSAIKSGDYYVDLLIDNAISGLKAHLIFD